MRFTLYPMAGLANRLRTIASALQLSKIFGCELEVIWELSFELNCKYFNIFKPHEKITIKEYPISHFKKSAFEKFQNISKNIGIKIPSGYKTFLLNEDVRNLKSKKFDFNSLRASNSLYIKTYEQLIKQGKDYSFVNPTEKIEEKLNNVVRDYSSNTIGVHIRRTDNLQSIKFSPIEYFIEGMNREIEQDEKTLFYLATDSTQDKDHLIRNFGDRILWREKTLERDSEVGIQDALVDLLCLSKTQKIIGSYSSSFTEVAAELHNIPLIQIVKK